MLYIIQRTDVSIFDLAKKIDPEYANTLHKAVNAGVEVIALKATVTPQYIHLINEIPVEIY